MSAFIGIKVEANDDVVTLHFDRQVANTQEYSQEGVNCIDDVLRTRLESTASLPDLQFKDDYFAATFRRRMLVPVEDSIQDLVRVLIEWGNYNPALIGAIIR